jgi:hypothetical protein
MAEPRATLVRRTLLTGSAGLALALIAAGCKKSEPASCVSTAGLTADDLRLRETFNYDDRSTDAAKTCERCAQYVPATEAGACGACKLLQGQIHPKGTCNVFSLKT